MSIQQTIAGILRGTSKTTAAELQANLDALERRLAELRARLDLIAPDGRERLEVARTGTPEKLLEMDREADLAEAEIGSLLAQREELQTRLARAQAEEAPSRVKKALAGLAPALELLEKARVAAAEAEGRLAELERTIFTQRRLATAAGIDCPAVSGETFERLADALGWRYPGPPAFCDEGSMKLALQRRRVDLTGVKPEPPKQPEMPWQRLERQRQAELRRKAEEAA